MKSMKLLMAGAALVVSVPAAAQTQVYSAPTNPTANQNWAGTLGLNFTVNAPVLVTSLGVFDNGANGSGLASTLSATIFRNSDGAQLIPTVTFASGTGGSGAAYIFQPLTTALFLAPGTYQIAAWGYGGEGNYNYGFVQSGNGGPIQFNSIGGRLTAVSSSYSDQSTPGVFATIPDNGNTRYGAGSFIASAIPEPATWAMMVMGFGMVGFGLRSRRKPAVRVSFA